MELGVKFDPFEISHLGCRKFCILRTLVLEFANLLILRRALTRKPNDMIFKETTETCKLVKRVLRVTDVRRRAPTQVEAIFVPLDVHDWHLVAGIRLQVDRLFFNAITTAHRVAGKLIDDVAVVANDNSVRKFLPGKPTINESDLVAGVCDTTGQIRPFVRQAPGQHYC